MLLQPNLSSDSTSCPRFFQIAFEKVCGNFLVLESSSSGMNGGGYRATLWNLNRQQRIEMISQLELDLQASALGITILPNKSYQTYQSNVSTGIISQQQHYLNTKLKFLTLEKNCIKIWEYAAGQTELLK